MGYRFFDRFAGCDERGAACNWSVVNNTGLSHGHRRWEPGAYILTAPGNRHLAHTPPLREFAFETVFAFNESVFTNRGEGDPGIRLFFRYDALTRRGWFVFLRFGKDRTVASLCREEGDARRTVAEAAVADRPGRPGSMRARLAVEGDGVRLSLDGAPPVAFALPAGAPERGLVGVDRTPFFGELRLLGAEIESPDDIPCAEVLPETAMVFPPAISGFHTPLRYAVRMTRCGGTVRLDLEISGSDAENPDVPWFPYHGLMIDALTAPYVRLGGRRLYPAGRGTLVLAAPNPERQKFFYADIHPKPEWPVRASFFLPDVPPERTIGFGYEYCMVCNHAQHLAGGPREAVWDREAGRVVHAGPAVRDGLFSLELRSQSDKEIRNRIPASDPRREAALAFARRNHFFVEPEESRFTAVVRCGGEPFPPEELRLTCRFETVFREEVERLVLPLRRAATPGLFPNEFTADLPPRTFRPGVHHLSLDLEFAGRTVLSERHPFEVLAADPAAPAPPVISGLPYLFSMPNEVKGLEQDQFEPYADVENPVAHYLSAATHYPDVGRRGRIWDTLHAYRREWFLWLTDRVAENPALDANRDIVAECDYIFKRLPFPEGCYAFEMWKPATFRGEVLTVLADFLREDERRAGPGKRLTRAAVERLAAENGTLPEEAIEELVAERWIRWLDHFGRWARARDTAFRETLRGINPRIRRSGYGPLNIYAAWGKTEHSLAYRGELMEFADGFYVFEDYPFSCRYDIHRGPILLAALQMAAPKVRFYPEVYKGSAYPQGCPDGLVSYGWPPFGCPAHPPETERKRFYEYVYATARFERDGFRYWEDHGFHVRAVPRVYFDIMLDCWRFIRGARPVKPLRAAAYAYDPEICRNHPAFYERSQPDGLPWGDIVNTAEETVPYIREAARMDGQQAGFLCAFDALDRLSPDDAALLVLPPLGGVAPDRLAAIRSLHERGVNLLAFECVEGLEDLFGVEPLAEPVAVGEISVAGTPGNPLAGLGSLREWTEHPFCRARYRAAGAAVLLEGNAPVLLLHRTPHGRTALFNIPPTLVRRDSVHQRVGYGRRSISVLINRAAAAIHRELSSPAVTTTAGKVIGFLAADGAAHVIVAEDAFPDEGGTIHPTVTVGMRGVAAERVSCDKPCSVFAEPEGIRVRLSLREHEVAIVTIRPVGKRIARKANDIGRGRNGGSRAGGAKASRTRRKENP